MNSTIWENNSNESINALITNDGFGIDFIKNGECMNKISKMSVFGTIEGELPQEIICRAVFENNNSPKEGIVIAAEKETNGIIEATYYRFYYNNLTEYVKEFTITIGSKTTETKTLYSGTISIEPGVDKTFDILSLLVTISENRIYFSINCYNNEDEDPIYINETLYNIYSFAETVSFGILGSLAQYGGLLSSRCINFDIYTQGLSSEENGWDFTSNNTTSLQVYTLEDLTDGLTMRTVKTDMDEAGYIITNIGPVENDGTYTLSFDCKATNCSPSVWLNGESIAPILSKPLQGDSYRRYCLINLTSVEEENLIKIGFNLSGLSEGAVGSLEISKIQLIYGSDTYGYLPNADSSFFKIPITGINEDIISKGSFIMSFSVKEEEEKTTYPIFNFGNMSGEIDVDNEKFILTVGSNRTEAIFNEDGFTYDTLYHLLVTWENDVFNINILNGNVDSVSDTLENISLSETQYFEIFPEETLGAFDNLVLSYDTLGLEILENIADNIEYTPENTFFWYTFNNYYPVKRDKIILSGDVLPESIYVVRSDGLVYERATNIENNKYSLYRKDIYIYKGELTSVDLPEIAENNSFYKYEGPLNTDFATGDLLVYYDFQWHKNQFKVDNVDIEKYEVTVDNVEIFEHSRNQNIISILPSAAVTISEKIEIKYSEKNTYIVNHDEEKDRIEIELATYRAYDNFVPGKRYNKDDIVFYKGIYYITENRGSFSQIYEPNWQETTVSLQIIYKTSQNQKVLNSIDLNPLNNPMNNGFLTVTQKENMVREFIVTVSPQDFFVGQSCLITIDSFGENNSATNNIDFKFLRGETEIEIGEESELKFVDVINNRTIYRFTPDNEGIDTITILENNSGVEKEIIINVRSVI